MTCYLHVNHRTSTTIWEEDGLKEEENRKKIFIIEQVERRYREKKKQHFQKAGFIALSGCR
jgi:hypothetical protein